MAAYNETLYVEQGATFAYGFVLYHPVLDGDGNVVYELDGDGNPVLDASGDPVPVPGSAVSLTGCLARMQIRARQASPEFIVSATSMAYDATTAPDGGRILLQAGGVTGRIDIILTDADTDLVSFQPDAPGAYDLEMVFPIVGGELRPRVERILEGEVHNDPNVTR